MRTRALSAFIFFSIVLYFVELTAATPAEPDTSKITADESEKKKRVGRHGTPRADQNFGIYHR